jgi:hypothetical protein
MRDKVIERLFSLFTSPDRAEAIAGDLIQERRDRGSGWFWRHAFFVAATLWAAAVAKAPLGTLLLAATGCALFAVPAFAGLAAVGLFPTLLGALAAWSLLAIFWWGGALWTGASVVAIAPARGTTACVTLVAIGEALLLASWVVGVRIHLLSVTPGILYMTAAAAAVPLLVGGAVAHARAIRLPRETPELSS